MTKVAEMIATFEAAGGGFSVEDGHVRVTYPKDRREVLIPVLTRLRAHREEVERFVLERDTIHSAQAQTIYMGRKKEAETKPTQPCADGSGAEEKQTQRDQAEDINLALKIRNYLDQLPKYQSATASEIAEALHGRNYTLEQMVEIYRICEELLQSQILGPGRNGYGYGLQPPGV